jgi:hypothetical protein
LLIIAKKIFLLKKQTIISFLSLAFFHSNVFAQHSTFSIATDLDLQRSIKKEQQYWAVGQTVHVHFHFTPRDGAYVWISYYSEGKFQNDLTALRNNRLPIRNT